MSAAPPDGSPGHKRRPRYAGSHPRKFHERYKERDPARYAADVERILASGKTPAGMHRPIMVAEVLACLHPGPGDVAVDCTLGGGGHTRELVKRVLPGGRVIGLDADPIELTRTEARLRAEGIAPPVFVARQTNFAALPQVLAAEGLEHADVLLADLGVSSMQLDDPDRGFTYKADGPLDMRMNPTRGQTAAELVARSSDEALAALLTEHSDEPHARIIAAALKARGVTTTQGVDRAVRQSLAAALPHLTKPEMKMSVRRTMQALRIAVNDELSSLDALLRALPSCVAPGGRIAILTFHSGEDRRVKKALQAGCRAGIYADIAREVIRSSMEETRANRRSTAAKLRWAVRAAF